MVKFLTNFDNRGIKIVQVNSILITKSINLQLFTSICTVLGVRCDVDIFKLTASAQSIKREVYGSAHFSALPSLYTPHSFWVPHPFKFPISCHLQPQVLKTIHFL